MIGFYIAVKLLRFTNVTLILKYQNSRYFGAICVLVDDIQVFGALDCLCTSPSV